MRYHAIHPQFNFISFHKRLYLGARISISIMVETNGQLFSTEPWFDSQRCRLFPRLDFLDNPTNLTWFLSCAFTSIDMNSNKSHSESHVATWFPLGSCISHDLFLAWFLKAGRCEKYLLNPSKSRWVWHKYAVSHVPIPVLFPFDCPTSYPTVVIVLLKLLLKMVGGTLESSTQ